MSDRAAFLAAICAAPDDDAPRLVYADWLDENGEPERAEFIRLQIKMSRCRMCHRKDGTERKDSYAANCGRCGPGRVRERNLWTMSLGWAHPFNGALDWFRRGLVERPEMSAADWLAHADALTAEHPVREVRLTTHPEPMKDAVFVDVTGQRRWFCSRWPTITFHLPPPPEHARTVRVTRDWLLFFGIPPVQEQDRQAMIEAGRRTVYERERRFLDGLIAPALRGTGGTATVSGQTMPIVEWTVEVAGDEPPTVASQVETICRFFGGLPNIDRPARRRRRTP